MKRLAAFLLLAFALLGCGGSETNPATRPVSEPGEKLYDIRGKILSRDTVINTVRVDHDAIPGFMEAMTMDYTVRGTPVADLPPDQSRFEAKLHVTQGGYWLTDVKRIP